jgi:hypothetical protein
MAADELMAAERHLAVCLAGAGNLEAALKLLGDVRLCAYLAPPPEPSPTHQQPQTAREYLDAAIERLDPFVGAIDTVDVLSIKEYDCTSGVVEICPFLSALPSNSMQVPRQRSVLMMLGRLHREAIRTEQKCTGLWISSTHPTA